MLVENWKDAWKWLSMYAFAIIAVLPDLFNLAIAQGLLDSESAPQTLNYLIKLLAFVGMAVRLVNQSVKDQNKIG